jgi:5,10-methenyltetrahydromethanopterin hydrogenase
MNYLNEAILKKNEEHWVTLRDAGYIKNLDNSDVEELQKVYQDEVSADFFVNKWCNSCVAEMVRTLYLATGYDSKQEAKLVKEEPKQEVQKQTRKPKK